MTKSFDADIKPEHYPTTDTTTMMQMDCDIMIDDAQDFFDRPGVDSQFKVELIDPDGTILETIHG
jgi:hypothetical protein